jgi:plastocyanin
LNFVAPIRDDTEVERFDTQSCGGGEGASIINSWAIYTCRLNGRRIAEALRLLHPLTTQPPSCPFFESHMRMRSSYSIALFAVGGMLACGGGGGGASSYDIPTTPPPSPTTSTDIRVENNHFSPTPLTVPVGSTVKWTWDTCGTDPYGGGAQTCVDHSVTWDAGAAASPTQSQGTYQRLFNTPGTYAYHCAIHGTAMSGQVVVQ